MLPSLDNYNVAGMDAYRKAYEQHLSAIQAVERDKLIPITVDIRKMFASILGVLCKIKSLEADLKELKPLKKYDGKALENLMGHLYALAHAQVLFTMATNKHAVTEHAEMAFQVREVMVADAAALAKRGLINPGKLTELNGGRGYHDVAFDLLALTSAMRNTWSTIAGRTALSLEELDRATALAHQLLTALGVKEQGPVNPQDTGLIRQQAFTLFLNSYDEVRRGVHFVRWHEGDADQIAPSIYAGRRRRSKTESVVTMGTDVPTQTEDGVEQDEPIDLSHLPLTDVLPELPAASLPTLEE